MLLLVFHYTFILKNKNFRSLPEEATLWEGYLPRRIITTIFSKESFSAHQRTLCTQLKSQVRIINCEVWKNESGLTCLSVKTTNDFKSMGIERRNCLFPDEKELDFFPEYSEANCALECAWKRARMECNCVPWFLKRLFPEDSMCEITGNDCFRGKTQLLNQEHINL